MKNFKFLTGVIFIIGVFLLVGMVGKAAGFGWYGFSQLCYEANLKGSPDTEVLINIVNLQIQAGCLNEQDSSIDCKAGAGNTGSFTIDAFPTASVGSDKLRNVVTINGCINLDKYTTHYQGETFIPMESCSDPFDTNCHIHICYPYDNPNKVEIADSAYVSTIDVYYDVINTTNGKIKYSAHQLCTYPGPINANTCLPEHNGTAPGGAWYFNCSEEQIINR